MPMPGARRLGGADTLGRFPRGEAATRSNTSVCLKVVDERVASLPEAGQAEFAKNLAGCLEKEGVALDAASYRSAPPGLRLWCGATVEQSDLQLLTPWLDWAFSTCLSRLTNR